MHSWSWIIYTLLWISDSVVNIALTVFLKFQKESIQVGAFYESSIWFNYSILSHHTTNILRYVLKWFSQSQEFLPFCARNEICIVSWLFVVFTNQAKAVRERKPLYSQYTIFCVIFRKVKNFERSLSQDTICRRKTFIAANILFVWKITWKDCSML